MKNNNSVLLNLCSICDELYFNDPPNISFVFHKSQLSRFKTICHLDNTSTNQSILNRLIVGERGG